ncbi:MAG: signal transduction histidine kinase (STHK), LytS [Pleurocapsa sp. MO_226.B13]|nr:signal transduction histidine kinase (STHK), LytS [Pleurocapsa sp. MO_226.B13]
MDTSQYKRAAGLYYSSDEAEAAVRSLRYSGYDLERITVIARDVNAVTGNETAEEIGNKADEGATTGAVTGGTLGGITGLLVGIGTLAIPGLGPILLAGAETTAIATTLASAGIGAAAGGLVGASIDLGIPEEKAKVYSDRVEAGSFLIMVTGTAAEVQSAATIMQNQGVEEFEVYNLLAPSLDTTPTAATTDVTIARADVYQDVIQQQS